MTFHMKLTLSDRDIIDILCALDNEIDDVSDPTQIRRLEQLKRKIENQRLPRQRHEDMHP